ncbi:MAG: glycosyltransferase family 1 protein [Solirubrobacteraceae bacterium]
MPRVALNLLYLDPGKTGGMEVVARELIPALIEAAPADLEFAALVNPRAAETEGPWQAMPMHEVPVDVANRFAWAHAELRTVPRMAKQIGADLLHSLGNTGPWAGEVRRSVTVNDLIHHRIPHPGLALKSRITGGLVGGGAKRATRVIVPATQTADDLVELVGVPRERIDMIPYGIAKPTVEATPEDVLRAHFELGDRPLVLSPSARQPHKNLERLLKAHALLASPRPLLVLPGYATGHDDTLQQVTRDLHLENDVRWLGWVTQPDLEGLYAASELLVFPSLYEGFGLPVLEAMQRGLPVACSDRGSLAEIAGGAALIFDPEHPVEIADAVRLVLVDRAQRQRLVADGLEHARRYTWAACAEGYVASFTRTLAG